MKAAITGKNPKYPPFRDSVAKWLNDIGEDQDYFEVEKLSAFIVHTTQTTERNPSPLFVILNDTAYLSNILPHHRKHKYTVLAAREPITGDPLNTIRVSWDSFASWQSLLSDEWEATQDRAWIETLMQMQEIYPAEPHCKTFEDVLSVHERLTAHTNSLKGLRPATSRQTAPEPKPIMPERTFAPGQQLTLF